MRLIGRVLGVVTFASLCQLSIPGSASAEPRPPIACLIPPTAPAIYAESFDAAYYAGARDEEITVDNFKLTESWSGYALQCSDSSVTPFIVPAVDGTGHININCNAAGAVQFWFKPHWSSASLANGAGPGGDVPLIELSAVQSTQSVVVWSLQINSDGTAMNLVAGGGGGLVVLLSAGISWQAHDTHLITLNYSPNGTTLLVDGTLVATGGGTLAIPPAVGEMSVGNSLSGTDPADGDFDELNSYSRPLTQTDVSFYYNALSPLAALGPIRLADFQNLASHRAGAQLMSIKGGPVYLTNDFFPQMCSLCDCMTGGPVYLTNVVATVITNQGMAVTFNLAGGTNFVWYGIYVTTNLANPQWVWLTNAYTCSLVSLTNQPGPYAFYQVRPPSPTMVVAWGANLDGQCDVPSGLTNAIAVSGGYNFSVALKADGTVIAWGDNTYGECDVPAGLSSVTSIAAGGDFVLALLQNGSVVAWGGNEAGQTNVPVGLTNVTAIAAGDACGLALQNDGTVVAWGYNGYGQTNIPAFGPTTQVAAGVVQGVALLTNNTVAMWSSLPGGYSGPPYFWGVTNLPAGLSNIIFVAAGGYHTLALQADGSVVAWGAGGTHAGINNDGQSIVPVGLSSVMAIAAGQLYSLALESDGTVATWGDDTYGELDQPERLTGVRMISAGGFHGLAIRYGMLTPLISAEPDSQTVRPGTNVTFSVEAYGVAGLTYQWQFNGVNIPGATNVTLNLVNVQSEIAGIYQVVISSGNGTVTSDVAILTILRPAYGPGLVSGWGSNTNGELSWQTATTNVISLAAGKFHGIAAGDSGQVATWGSYWTGYSYVPVTAPPLLTNAVAVAAGSRHDLVLKSDGTLTVWGFNDFGQTNIPALATNVIAIAASGQQSLALRQNGTVVQWGQTNGPVPTGLVNVTAIAAGTNFVLALLQNSTVIAWGADDYGQTNIPPGLTNVVAIAAGGSHALALRQNGTVVAWGSWTNVPANLTNAMKVAAGENHSLAIKNDGTLLCWGDDTFGQTNVVSGLINVKLMAGGGDFTLASEFGMAVSYPVNVPTDLLLVYNTNSADSAFVLNYYLMHRPMVSGANVLGIGCPGIYITNFPANNNDFGLTNTTAYESVCPEDFTNQVQNPVLDWLAENPTLRPQYVILMLDVPSRVNSTATNASAFPFYGPGNSLENSVSYQLATMATGWQPFISHINLQGTNDCIAYINKLQYFGTNYSPGKLVISASAGGYCHTNWYFDDTEIGYAGNTPGILAGNGVFLAGASPACIIYTNISPDIGLSCHITSGVNVAGYLCWGQHSSLMGSYAYGEVNWTGNSGWYLIDTIESFNGQRYQWSGGHFTEWFAINSFGGTDYSNTPVGAVSTVDEPWTLGASNPQIYFGMWQSGKNFGICAWNSRLESFFHQTIQVIGDPFVTK